MSPLDQAETALVDALAAVRAARGYQLGTPAAAQCDILEVDEAEHMSGKDASTVRKWAARYGLGRKLGGRWLLSRSRFEAFLRGGAR